MRNHHYSQSYLLPGRSVDFRDFFFKKKEKERKYVFFFHILSFLSPRVNVVASAVPFLWKRFPVPAQTLGRKMTERAMEESHPI